MPLSSRVPDLRALDMLLSVAKLGSLGRAAEEQGVTQQAASSRMKRMEHLLGLSLVERTTDGSRLTPTGAMVADWARTVVQEAASLDRGVQALRDQAHDHLRIAASMTVAEYLMPAWLVTAHHEDPSAGVSLSLCNSSEVVRRVQERRAALGFVEMPTRPTSVRSTTVGRDELVVVVGSDHPWTRRRRAVDPSELAATQLVERESGSGTRSTLHRALRRAGVGESAPPLLELTSTTAIKAAVTEGLAPAVISSLAVSAELTHGRLVRVQVVDLNLNRTLRAVWSGGTELLGTARSFVALARRSYLSGAGVRSH